MPLARGNVGYLNLDKRIFLVHLLDLRAYKATKIKTNISKRSSKLTHFLKPKMIKDPFIDHNMSETGLLEGHINKWQKQNTMI